MQVGDKLYVIGGYAGADEVLNRVDVLDLKTGAWNQQFPTPPDMPQSHLAVTVEKERFVYVVSGQFGPQCRPAVPRSYSLDLATGAWTSIPPLPAPRYAATGQLWKGRLHVVGGSKEDRGTPAHDHWSIAVSDGRATEDSWREELPIPRGGPHRASAVCDGTLWVFGGQEGDYVPIIGDPYCQCDGKRVIENHHAEVYALAPGASAWRKAPGLCLAVSHTEFSTYVAGHRVYLFGGQHHRDPVSKRMTLSDAIQCYDTRSQSATIVGLLPYRVKTNVIGVHNNVVYSALGQRDRSATDASPDEIVAHTWRAPFTCGTTRDSAPA